MVWSEVSKYGCHPHTEVSIWFWMAFDKYTILSRKYKHLLFAKVIVVAGGLLGKMKFIFQDVAIINHYTKKAILSW